MDLAVGVSAIEQENFIFLKKVCIGLEGWLLRKILHFAYAPFEDDSAGSA